MKKHIYTISFSLVLAAFTLFVVLDTFVISRPMKYAQGEINTSMFNNNQSNSTISDSETNKKSTTNTGSNQTNNPKTESVKEKTDASGNSFSTAGADLIGEYKNDQASIKLYK